MEPSDLLDAIRQTPNRGMTHLFLGEPSSEGRDKTTVEPGNTYSPGVWTCGVSLWVECDGQLATPDRMPPEAVDWRLIVPQRQTVADEPSRPDEQPDSGPDSLPAVEATWQAGEVQIRHRLGYIRDEKGRGVDLNHIRLVSQRTRKGTTCHIVVRDEGPAGARISEMSWDEHARCLRVDAAVELIIESDGVRCRIVPADAQHDSPLAIITLAIDLAADKPADLFFYTVHTARWPQDEPIQRVPPAPRLVAEGFERLGRQWPAMLPARVFAPDARIAAVWQRCAYHILAAMEQNLPRIGAVNYPVYWIRDCIIVNRALDVMGRHDLARRSNEYLAPMIFGGGFGAEADAPGEGIWSLVSHARMTGDRAWLEQVFPNVQRRVEWLDRMLHATAPVRAMSENRIPSYMMHPGTGIVCAAARDGLIHGRMDWHCPDFYINCWAVAGYQLAAWAAGQLDLATFAQEWSGKAEKLAAAVRDQLLPRYGNPRDPAVAPWPSGAFLGELDLLRGPFENWYRVNRLTEDGRRKPEPLWTYFEAAHIHNAIALGLRRQAWVNLDGMLDSDYPWPVSVYHEGRFGGNECLPYRNGEGRRGWLRAGSATAGNMPHNWTSAEMICLLRDVFVRETDDGLVLGEGVPSTWLTPGSCFGVRDLPTGFGKVSYEASVDSQGRVSLDYAGPQNYRVKWR